MAIVVGVPNQVFGYGLGDAESSVMEINEKKLKMKTVLSPEVIEEQNHEFDLKVELLDSISGEAISNVGYNFKILDSDDVVLFDDKIFTKDEILLLNFKAKEQENFEFIGEKNDKEFWTSSKSQSLLIEGPVFLNGGIYKIQTTVKFLENSEIQQQNLFETTLIIGEIIPFRVIDGGVGHDLRFITYFDKIENLSFDEDMKSVQAEMRFNWDPSFVDSVPFVHSEVYVPFSWEKFANNEINTFVNGIQVFGLVDRSQEDEIIIHFLVNNKQLKNLTPQIMDSEKEKIIFEIRAGEEIELITTGSQKDTSDDAMMEVSTKEDWKVYFWWEPKGQLLPEEDITFNIMFHDPDSNIMQKNITYDFEIYQNNELIFSKPSSQTPSGHDLHEFTFEENGGVKIITGNINGVNTKTEFEFFVGDPSGKISIPTWVKNNASWWAEGKIDDSTFASGIEFMIKEKIIQVPETEKQEGSNAVIPDWVRNNASWWATDKISDKDFASGLQYLIKSGIITV